MRALFLFLAVALPLDALAAYAQSTVIREPYLENGRTCEVISYTESDVAAASEAVVQLNWRFGFILSTQQDLTGGAAATIQTRYGRDPSFTADSMGQVGVADAAAAYVHEQGQTVFHLRTSKKLYVRAGVNAGTDNTVSSEIIVCKGAP